MRLRVLWLTAIAATSVGCGGDGGGSAATEPDSAQLAQWKVELVEADRAFARSVRTAGLGGWLSAFAPEGMMISGGTTHSGLEGVRRAMLPVFPDTTFALEWDPTLAEVAEGGDLGYTIGKFEARSAETGEVVTMRGSYLTVWRRQANGAWKVEADIGNPEAE